LHAGGGKMDFPKRKKIRLEGYDYSQNGAYFVTICSKNRAHLFGHIAVEEATPGQSFVLLTEMGKCIDQTIRNINMTEENDVRIDTYVIMP
jgi:REP element-mobilizing transposase RayT